MSLGTTWECFTTSTMATQTVSGMKVEKDALMSVGTWTTEAILPGGLHVVLVTSLAITKPHRKQDQIMESDLAIHTVLLQPLLKLQRLQQHLPRSTKTALIPVYPTGPQLAHQPALTKLPLVQMHVRKEHAHKSSDPEDVTTNGLP